MSIAEPPPEIGAADPRRELMAERVERSRIWRVIRWLASLQLALIILAVIAISCAVATFTESHTSTKIAQAYIYKSAWFQLALVALCINLCAVTVTRWPWQKKHIGFVVTHYGIITLLIGAIIGLRTGFEGNIVLHKGNPAADEVRINQNIAEIINPEGKVYSLPFDAETARLGEGRTRRFVVPETDLAVVADQFSPNLIPNETLVAQESDGVPGLLVRLSSGMMGQSLTMPLLLKAGSDQQDLFGLARISLQPGLPDEAVAPPREMQMVFAHFAPVISGPIKTDVRVGLSPDGKEVSIVGTGGVGATYQRAEIMNHPLNEAGAVITVEQYWPDFVMKDGAPTSKSDQPNNPTILVSVTKGEGKPSLVFALGGGEAHFRLSRGGQPYQTGTAAVGQPFALGWADWKAEILQIVPKAGVQRTMEPGPALVKGQQGIPGLHVSLVDPTGPRGPGKWVASGQMVTLGEGDKPVRFSYGLNSVALPFTLSLLNFEVPRDEGTDTPSNFIATVEFRDPTSGQTKIGQARMNHPASFPGTLWAGLTGLNYKFSQAAWNPRDLDETTLQVLYDPGWLLKWVGSLGICLGIAIMFYWKPNRKG